MSEYGFSDYGIFSSAISTVTSLNEKMATTQTAINECKAKISSDSIFMGPAADSCKQGLATATTRVTSLTENFTTISNYLKETSTTYKEGDDAAKAKVLSITDGKITASTLDSIRGNNGQVIYYNQNGWYDENGKLHRWESTWGKSIASSGCGPTSMAAVLANLLNDPSITPSTIANMMNYDDNIGGTYVAKAANRYGLDAQFHIGLGKEAMNTFLRNNGKMIVAVNNGGHYIAVLGINDSTNPPTYIVCDPNDWNTAKKTWTYNDIATGHTMVMHIAPKGKTVQQCLQQQAQTVQV